MSTNKPTPELSAEIKGKFELKGYVPGVIILKGFGEVDFTTISLNKAEKVAVAFPYLLARVGKPEKPETGTKP